MFLPRIVMISLLSIIAGCTNKTKPMSYGDVIKRKEINFPFPVSSSNIIYDVINDWQLFVMDVQFDAPVTDCVNHIDTVFAWDNVVEKRTSVYSRVHFTNASLDDTSWRDSRAINGISNGLHAGVAGSHKPEIWVDLDKGVFYFHKTD